MAPSRERGGGPAPGQQRPQGQAAGGRGGGRGPHGGGRGPNPNASAGKKVHDNGSVPEKAPQQQSQAQAGSTAAAEPAKTGGWGSGVSFKDKLMAPKQEPAPTPPVAAPAKESAAKPAANGPDAPKQTTADANAAATPAPPASGTRPYAAAVSSPSSGGGAAPESSSDIQFGSFTTDGEAVQSKEQPAAPQGPLPTAVPAAVEAVRHQSRQVIRTNSAPASANPAQEGERGAPVFVPHKVERVQQQTRMAAPTPPPAAPATPPPPPPAPEPTLAPQLAILPDVVPPPPPPPPPPPLPTVPAPPVQPAVPAAAPVLHPMQAPPPAVQGPPRDGAQHRQPPPPQQPLGPMGGPAHGAERQHLRQGGHERQPHPGSMQPMPYVHAATPSIPQPQPGGPGMAPPPHRHGHHPPPPPPQMQQSFGPTPTGQPPQPSHHHIPQQPPQPGGQRGGNRGGPAPQQVPVQVSVQLQGGYPQAPYGMQHYGHQATQPINMAQPQHGYAAVPAQHGHMPAAGAGMAAPPPPQYVVGSPNQYPPPPFVGGPPAFFPPGTVMQPPVAMPLMAMPMPTHPHHHAAGPPHGAPTHMLASSPNISVGFHVPPQQQHAPPPTNYAAVPSGPQPTPIALPIPPPGAGAGSGAPNAPVAAAAQAAINATNAAAPGSAVPPVMPPPQPVQPPPPHAPTASPPPAQAPSSVPAVSAGASGGSGGAPAPAAPQPVSAPPPPKAASTPPPPPAKKVLKIVDPSSHKEVNLAESAAAGAGGDGRGAEGVGPSVTKPVSHGIGHAPAPPPKKVLEIKEPTPKPAPEPKPTVAKPAEAKPAEAVAAKPVEPAKQAEPVVTSAAVKEAAEVPATSEAVAAPEPAAAAPEPAVSGVPETQAASPEAVAIPAKQPASFQIDVAEEEEGEESKASSAPTPVAVPETPPVPAPAPEASVAPAPPAPAAEEAAAASASGSGSGDDSSAPSATNSGAGSRKKNLKQTLKDADAKPANNDLLSAFREPPPPPKPEAVEPAKPKEAPAAEEVKAPAAPAEDVTDHWEERVDEATAAEASASGPSGDGDTRKRYSRDYLLAIGSRIVVPLTRPLDNYHQPIIGLEAPQDNTRIGVGLTLGRSGSREVEWGRGRDDRGRSGEFRGGDMRGDRGGMGGDRRERDGMRGGAGGRGGQGGMDRRGSANMDDGWQRRGPPPPPSPGGDMRSGGSRGMSRQGSGPVPYGGGGPVNLHKSDNRWQVGVTTADDPEEEKKQKTFKGILNKLTPDNYDKLKQQILAVPITHQKTLEGFINQIFDKALIETTFSEMYANLCKEIHPSLPQFPSNDPNNTKPVDFRRLLLNKCQQEFEDGVAAMKKVKEREEHDKEAAGKQAADKAAATASAAENGNLEEGEVPQLATATSASTDDAKAKALADAAEAERELKARRRMLGNIQFIGHLYKCGLLTERIIHSCIVQLLNDETSPRPDDIECLCKLLTTLGKQLEEQALRKGAANGNALDVYFSRMARLRTASNLDSRIKFAIQDVLDLRAAKWVSRRKVEGPKRIEDVHREAQAQMAAQASRDREERYAQRGPGGRGGPGMGGREAPPPPGRFGGPAPQDEARLMGRGEVARPLRGAAMERQASSEVSLRPSSFLTSKRTSSPAQPAGAVAAAAAREAVTAAVRQAPSAAAAPAPPPREERGVPPPPAGMSEEAAKKKGALWVKELYEVKEQSASADALLGLKTAGAPMGAVLSAAIKEAFEVRGIDPAARLDLLKEVLVEQLTSTNGVLNSSMLEDAFGRFMGELDTWIEDNPKAAGVAAKAVGELAALGHLSLGPCLRPILEAKSLGGGGDDDEGGGASDLPPLVEMGVAGQDILANVLQAAVSAGGTDKAAELWRASGLDAAKFFDMPEDAEELASTYSFLSG